MGAVTGFETGSEYFENVFQIPVYQGEDLTGIISSGSGIGDELRAPDEEIVTPQHGPHPPRRRVGVLRLGRLALVHPESGGARGGGHAQHHRGY